MKSHELATQTAVPCAGVTQLLPQPPQFCAFVVMFTHIIPQRVGVIPPQPLAHT